MGILPYGIQRPIFILQTTESYSELGCKPRAQMIYLLVPAKVTLFHKIARPSAQPRANLLFGASF